MVSKQLLGVWAFFDFALLAFGAVAVAMSIIIQGSDDPLIQITFIPAHLMAALILGVLLLVTFVISIGAIIQQAHILVPLIVLNWALVVDGIAVVVVGCMMWVATLAERSGFKDRFIGESSDFQIKIQDKLNCCGYMFPNETTQTISFGGTVCPNPAAALARNSSCVLPLTDFTDNTLNSAFTLIFAFMFAIIPLLLATLCVIKKREEDERFKRIDSKRGGRGFV